MRLLSLFTGIGAFEKALKNLGVPYELVGFSEIDEYAVKAYCAIHGVSPDKNLGDITKIDTMKLHDIDLVTYGFPCQDISAAGQQQGFTSDDGTLTRSGLFFEALRVIQDTQPKIAIAENVKALTSKKFANEFKIVLQSLEDAGYNNYWQILNAKDYGIPQNRPRVFIVSIRKDIDTGTFTFPQAQSLTRCMKDLLETDVDEKYFLTADVQSFFISNSLAQESKGNGFRFTAVTGGGIAKCLTTRAGNRMDDNFIVTNLLSDICFTRQEVKNFEDYSVGEHSEREELF
jgi:DNA (cytosine-5)-methyltransferase 1